MTTIQDFLDEKELEGIIDNYVSTKHSIQFDKVMKELKGTTTYTITRHNISGVFSMRNNRITYKYLPIKWYHLLFERLHRQSLGQEPEPGLPINRIFPEINGMYLGNDNTLQVYRSHKPNESDSEFQQYSFRKNRAMMVWSGQEVLDNQFRYEDLL